MWWTQAHTLVSRQNNLMRWHTKEAKWTAKKNACESLPKIRHYLPANVRQMKWGARKKQEKKKKNVK